MELILIAILSYLLGSIPFSYLIARIYGKNLYQIGTGNIGAANVYRATGKFDALLLAVVGDIGKGALAIFLSQKFFSLNILPQAIAAFFVILGHNWPIFLKFKGGRGLASLFGVILFLNWKAILLIFLTIGFFIFLTEMIMKKGIKLKGNFKEKMKNLFSIFISQVLGRVIGIVIAIILICFFYPQLFKIAFPATILAGMKHIQRVRGFLKK